MNPSPVPYHGPLAQGLAPHVAICLAGSVLLGCTMVLIWAPSSGKHPAICKGYAHVRESGSPPCLGPPHVFGRKCVCLSAWTFLGQKWQQKKAPDVQGDVGANPLARLEPRCLEVLGPELPAKTTLMLGAMLGPARLEGGSGGAWKV